MININIFKKATYLFTFGLVTAISLLLYLFYSIEQHKDRVQALANGVYVELHEKLKANDIILSSFEALFKSVDDPEYRNARKYAQEIVAKYKHVYMLEVFEAVKHQDKQNFERQMSQRLGFAYRIKSFEYSGNRQWTEAKKNDVYYPVTFMYPENKNVQSIYGLDVFSVPHLRDAAIKAISINDAYASRPFELAEGGDAFIVFRPVAVKSTKGVQKYPSRLIALLILNEQLLDKQASNLENLDIRLSNPDEQFDLQLHKTQNSPYMVLQRIKFDWSLGAGEQKFYLTINSVVGWDVLNPYVVMVIVLLNGLAVWLISQYYLYRQNTVSMQVRFGRILDNSANEIYIFTADDLRFVQVNQGAQNNLGYSHDELLQMTPYDIKPLFDEEKFREVINPLLSGGQDSLQFNTIHQRKDGSEYPVEVNLQLYLHEEPMVFVAIILDISQRIQDQERLTYLAKYDELTGLPNRSMFREYLQHAMRSAKRKNMLVGLMFIDVDNFKIINDTLGHDVGDELLKSIASRIKNIVRESDTVSRIGGDEFTIIIEDCEYSGQLIDIANKIHNSFDEPFSLIGKTIFSNVSIGIAIYPNDAGRIDDLLKAADAAMYQAKENGRGRYYFFTRDMNQLALEKLELESELRKATIHGDFELFYQPQINLLTNEVMAYEALIRWEKNEGEFISPDKFIPVAEETGLILDIGEWVIRSAVYQSLMLNAEQKDKKYISINVSGRQFLDRTFFTRIQKLLRAVDGIHECLELEITESVLLNNLEENIRILQSLRELGMRIAVDDFGTGYSSLNYLKKLPIDTLKIDRSFISGVCENRQDAAIATTIITLAKSLDLKVVAEGVETEEQLAFLKQGGCDAVQGFLIAKPMPFANVPAWYGQWNNPAQ